jgi:hypothetical protein
MSIPEVVGIVLGVVSILMLLFVLYMLQRVYVVVRRDQLPGASKDKAASLR